jgi:hypothetical protein
MNKKAILRVADAIENAELAKDGIGFNMLSYHARRHSNYDHTGHNCATTCCIAGWAIVLNGERPHGIGVVSRAAELMSLDWWNALDLFEPNLDIPYSNITAAQAVRTLRHLAETGEVSWEV